MVALHPLAARFAAVAESYERGRPEYPPAVIGALSAELGLRCGDAVLDLAAGTGKLTRALLAGGLDVLAVEPQEALRARLRATVGAERVRDGLAEAIPLPDDAVAAVTVADAFHWFEQAAALREIARVLARGGGLAVLTTAADWSGASWAHEVGSMVAELRPEHPQFEGPPWQETASAVGAFEPPWEVRVTTLRRVEPERMIDHVASMSWIAALPAEQRSRTVARIRELIGSGSTPEQLPLHVTLGLTRLAP